MTLETPPAGEVHFRLSTRIATVIGVVLPFLGLIAAIVCVWGWGITWLELVSLAVMYTLTGLGITVGYHRLFTHKSFDTYRVVKAIFAILGSMAVQGPLVQWVAVHRRHHIHSDHEHDPHSPHLSGGGVRGVFAGWWHAHMGWIFRRSQREGSQYVRDLQHQRMLKWISRLFGVWVGLGLAIPTVVCGLVMHSWSGALLGLLWGGLVRVFLVHHMTWSINSICHLWGRRRFESRDESRNNAICGVFAFGEGWHNNHHAFPGSARHGLRWYELDLGYFVIRLLRLARIAWDVRTPSPLAIRMKTLAS